MVRNWGQVLIDLEHGDPAAVLAISRIITGFLIRARAYTLRDSWDDLCQEVLAAVIRNIRTGQLREPDAFVGYLGAITRNKLADWLNAHRHVADTSGHSLHIPDPASTLRDEDLLLDLQRALDELDQRHRKVIETIYIAGYSYEQAAQRLGMPLGTLKRLQTGALRSIRKRLLPRPEHRPEAREQWGPLL